MKLVMIALGGAIGAIARYWLSTLPFDASFPFATFLTNIMGAFIIGVVVGLSEHNFMTPHFQVFLKTGFCGGFTTFSTFSLESSELLLNEQYVTGGIYMISSLICCVIGVILGQQCSKLFRY